MRKILTILFCVSIFTSSGFGQEIIFSKETKRNSIPIRYNRNSSEAYINAMLDTLASNSNDNNRRGLIFFYDTKLKIEKLKTGTLHFVVSLGGINYRGNTSYRNFSMNDVMIPNMASFILDWYSGDNQRILSIPVENAMLDKKSLLLTEIPQRDSLKLQDYNIRTKGFNFHFDEQNWMEFKTKVDAVDEYYRDYDSIQAKITHIRTTNFSTKHLQQDSLFLPKASRFVHDTKAFIKDVQSKNYADLGSNQNSKIPNLSVNLEILEEINKHLYDSVQMVISDTYLSATQNIEEHIKRHNFTEAQAVITQQLFPLGLYAIGNYYLAEIYFLQGKQEFSRKKMILLANKFSLDDAVLEKSKRLVLRLDRVMLDSAQSYVANGKVEQSIQALKKASDLLELFSGSKDLIKHNPLIVNQLKSIQQGYVEHGLRQFEVGNFHDAIGWYNASKGICNDFAVDLCGDELNNQILASKQEYQKKLVNAGLESIQKYDLSRVETLIEEEREFREDNELTQTELAKQMCVQWAAKKYIKNLKEGNKAYKEGRYQLAMDTLLHAKKLAQEYNIETVDYLDSILFNSSEKYLHKYLAHKDSFATINPIEIEGIIEQISEIKSESDPETATRFEPLMDKLTQMHNAACDYQRSEYGKYMAMADVNIQSASFLMADSLLQLAIIISTEFESCQIDPVKAFEAKQEIAFGVGYELALDKIMLSIQDQNYPEAISQYESLTEFYNAYRLHDIGLSHDSLQAFIANTDDIMFINFCIGQFSDLENFETALYLLNNLYIRGINSDLSRNGQIALGIILATNDFRQNSGRPVKEMIERYTNGDKWFEHFEHVYELRWEKLQQSK